MNREANTVERSSIWILQVSIVMKEVFGERMGARRRHSDQCAIQSSKIEGINFGGYL